MLAAERVGASGFRSIPPAGLLGGKGGGGGGGAQATREMTDVLTTARDAREWKNMLRTLGDTWRLNEVMRRVNEASQIYIDQKIK